MRRSRLVSLTVGAMLAGAALVAATPAAARTFVSVGIGTPGFYGYGYPGYYPAYGYAPYGYGYPGYYPAYYGPRVIVGGYWGGRRYWGGGYHRAYGYRGGYGYRGYGRHGWR